METANVKTESAKQEIGNLKLNIARDSLRSIIASGRVLELADVMAKEAAAQISAQIVDQIASAALKTDGLKSGVSISASFIFDGGDFGTRPPRPPHGVVRLEELAEASSLRRLAVGTKVAGG